MQALRLQLRRPNYQLSDQLLIGSVLLLTAAWGIQKYVDSYSGTNGQSVSIKLKKDLGQGEKVQVGLEVYHFCRKTFLQISSFSAKICAGHVTWKVWTFANIINVTKVNIFGIPTIFLHMFNWNVRLNVKFESDWNSNNLTKYNLDQNSDKKYATNCCNDNCSMYDWCYTSGVRSYY